MKEIKTKFKSEELLEMISERGLSIKLVLTVKQEGIKSEYKMIVKDMEELEESKRMFNLTIIEEKYMLLTYAEEEHIREKGYLKI